jgi:hypothetical protein
MTRRRVAVTVVIASLAGVVATVGAGGMASAGGSSLVPDRDSYQPGEQATMVGETGAGQLGTVEDGPFFAYLRVDRDLAAESSPDTWPFVHPSDLPLGELVLATSGRAGDPGVQVSLIFTIPLTLEPGTYEVVYCNDPCTTGLGDLIGGTIHVGGPPPVPVPAERCGVTRPR